MPDEPIALGVITESTSPEEVRVYIDKLKASCLELSQENERVKSERWQDDKVSEAYVEKARLTHELDCKKADCESELRKKTLIQAEINVLLKDISNANIKTNEIEKLLAEAHERYDQSQSEMTYYQKGVDSSTVEQIAAGKEIVSKTRLCLRDLIENHDRVIRERGLSRDRSRDILPADQERIVAFLSDTSTYSSVLCSRCKYALQSVVSGRTHNPLHRESITNYWYAPHHNKERKSNTTISPYALTDQPSYML